MPQVTVYIRAKDLPKWKAIDKKSEFIHKALNKLIDPSNLLMDGDKIAYSKNILPSKPDPKKAARPNANWEVVVTDQNGIVEAHDLTKLALERACCKLKKPCQHWSFNDGKWINSLSGREKGIE